MKFLSHQLFACDDNKILFLQVKGERRGGRKSFFKFFFFFLKKPGGGTRRYSLNFISPRTFGNCETNLKGRSKLLNKRRKARWDARARVLTIQLRKKQLFPPISHLVCRAKEGNMGEGSKSSRCPGKKLSGILRAKRCRAILSSPLLLLLLLLRPIRSDGHQMVPKLGGERGSRIEFTFVSSTR